ncbi:diacylglycerol kinase [Helicobacter anseris]|uniref:Diacylglycerol kinase n=1 Tax=Helicobacter anseris TaxID=375926 RepID=A0A3D8J547_9HELI|nr:diacylglycerol kinase [Helicobacter anseris]RDU72622.1 diacylglycerol kinase [Helicobacter anseris]
MQDFRNDKKGKKGLKRLFNAYKYSVDGIMAAWKDEEAFRQILVLGIIFGILGMIIGQDWGEKVLLLLPSILCIVGELINSAIENAIDFTSKDIHPLAKKAKDMGSAVQLVLLIFFVVIWASYIFFKFY